MKIAVIQMHVVKDKEKNLRSAEEYIAKAAAKGADMAVLPELFCISYSGRGLEEYAEPARDRVWTFMSETARKYRIGVVAGSMPESEDGKIYNTSFVFDRQGQEIARHRKVHLFDVNFEGGHSYKESDVFAAGSEITVFDFEGTKFGLCVCFDIRFPEQMRLMALKGAEAFIIPASFSMKTGPMHWELLFRMRAVDNLVYTIGCAPSTDTAAEYVSYANSIACSPMGEVIARAGSEPEMFMVDIEHDAVEEARRKLPLLSARRTDIYEIVRHE